MSVDVLRTLGLSRRYGFTWVLSDVHLTVKKGQVYGFLGRNGAGKTTALSAIMGITRPTRGRVELFGRAGRGPSLAERRRIGFVSQEQFFYDWMTPRSIGEFVGGFYPTWDGSEFARLLDALDVPARRRISALSVGMRRKLALALALAPSPELLLLDEPTAGLDPVARREFLDLLRVQAREQERTTLFSTHRIDEAEEFADVIGVIERGRMLFEGGVGELRATVRRVEDEQREVARAAGLEELLVERDGRVVMRGEVGRWKGVDAEAMWLEDIFVALVKSQGAP